ncbi:preprotein translocase subunit YajC [Isoalcanivorax indicus]|uniref:preprotein translocase subunit YajC n=1 Tax=Isoalcanivorax indicus TaxID=2202653 RepID=UPI000DBA3100|nr:preprotein translocase subunit YajC [Isoalcanivorax indicus]
MTLFARLPARTLLALAGILMASPAFAEGGPGGGGFELIFIIVMMVVFYFFLIRPQTKRAKEHRELVGGLAKGDEVVTSGGILGKINKVTEDYVVIEIANNLEVKVQKHAVQATLPKGTIKSV